MKIKYLSCENFELCIRYKNTKLSDEVDAIDGGNAFQRDLDRLEECIHVYFMKLTRPCVKSLTWVRAAPGIMRMDILRTALWTRT